MKLRIVVICVLAPVVLLTGMVAIGAGIDSWHHLELFYPTPETESDFLKTYSPEHIVDQFIENESHASSGGLSCGAGREFVSYAQEFQFYVVMRREKWTPLVERLREDALQQLATNRAMVVSQVGDSDSGFRFEYKIGRSVGSLLISPVRITSPPIAYRKISLPQGMEDVTLQIKETEQWFPKGPITSRPAS